MKTGIEIIAEERRRQIEEEGWKDYHDDIHVEDELSRAAGFYALPKEIRVMAHHALSRYYDISFWPWPGQFKPTPNDRI